MLCTALLDKNGNLLTSAVDNNRVTDPEQRLKNRSMFIVFMTGRRKRSIEVVGKMRVRPTESDSASAVNGSDIPSPSGDQQLLVTVSERSARVIGLPSHQLFVEHKVRLAYTTINALSIAVR